MLRLVYKKNDGRYVHSKLTSQFRIIFSNLPLNPILQRSFEIKKKVIHKTSTIPHSDQNENIVKLFLHNLSKTAIYEKKLSKFNCGLSINLQNPLAILRTAKILRFNYKNYYLN